MNRPERVYYDCEAIMNILLAVVLVSAVLLALDLLTAPKHSEGGPAAAIKKTRRAA